MDHNTFFWHDYETFGDNPRRDRPAQFAGVRTDMDLNVVAEPVMLYCRPAPDFVPHPRACLVTGITPQVCLEKGLPEHEFARMVQVQMAYGGTITTGYNTFSFDSEVTRFMLYRNLADSYAHEWRNGCARWDILDLMRTAYAFKPDGIAWPAKEGGGVSFRLEDLTAANGLVHENAHDALSDVFGTIGLAKLVKTLYPELFAFCLSLRSKDAVLAQMALGSNKPFIHISWVGGGNQGGINIMLPIGANPYNKNDMICWDLRQDPTPLLEMTIPEIKSRLFAKRDELPEGVERLGFRAISINKSPVVVRGTAMLSPAIVNKWAIDLGAMEKNAIALLDVCEKMHLRQKLAELYQRSFDKVDPDEDLYGGFISNRDRDVFDEAHCVAPGELATLSARLQEPKTRALLFRYRARNFPETLSAAEQAEWKAHLHTKLVLGTDGQYTIGALRKDIANLLPEVGARGQEILNQLSSYADMLSRPTDLVLEREGLVDSDMEAMPLPGAM